MHVVERNIPNEFIIQKHPYLEGIYRIVIFHQILMLVYATAKISWSYYGKNGNSYVIYAMHVVERNIPNEFIIQKHRTQMNNKYPPPPNTQTQNVRI
jgi:hypothetical protein